MSEAEGAAVAGEAVTGETADVGTGGTIMSDLMGDGGQDAAVAGGQDAEQTDNAEPGKEADPAGLVPQAPDGYALTFAEGVEVDQGMLAAFQGVAHELGLQQGQAQKLADMYVGQMTDIPAAVAKGIQERQAQSLLATKQAWEAEIKADPEYAANVEHAKRALVEFGSPEFGDYMRESVIGSHPLLFGFVANAGKALAEPGFKGVGVGAGREKPIDQRMWPDMK